MSQITHIVEDVITDPERLISEAERAAERYGTRNLLTSDAIAELASDVRNHSALKSILANLVAVQAIYFKKTRQKNWGVALHKDTILPMCGSGSWRFAGTKEDKAYYHAPADLLNQCRVIRISLDDVPEGDLMIPESESPSSTILSAKPQIVPQGGALVMKPCTTPHMVR